MAGPARWLFDVSAANSQRAYVLSLRCRRLRKSSRGRLTLLWGEEEGDSQARRAHASSRSGLRSLPRPGTRGRRARPITRLAHSPGLTRRALPLVASVPARKQCSVEQEVPLWCGGSLVGLTRRAAGVACVRHMPDRAHRAGNPPAPAVSTGTWRSSAASACSSGGGRCERSSCTTVPSFRRCFEWQELACFYRTFNDGVEAEPHLRCSSRNGSSAAARAGARLGADYLRTEI